MKSSTVEVVIIKCSTVEVVCCPNWDRSSSPMRHVSTEDLLYLKEHVENSSFEYQ